MRIAYSRRPSAQTCAHQHDTHTCTCTQAGLGRQQGGPRNGPRPVDLDIIFFEGARLTLGDPDLTIPHRSWQERAFVTAPLADLADCCQEGTEGWRALQQHLDHAQRVWQDEHAGTDGAAPKGAAMAARRKRVVYPHHTLLSWCAG